MENYYEKINEKTVTCRDIIRLTGGPGLPLAPGGPESPFSPWNKISRI